MNSLFGARDADKPRLCDSPLWDTNYTWNSSQPKFTECFRYTLLIYIPTSILLLAIIYNIYLISREKLLSIPWNKYNILKVTITSLLVSVKLLQTISELYDSNSSDFKTNRYSISLIIGPLIQLLSYVILLIIYLFQQKAGLHTNGFIWFYLFSSLICEGLRYYAIFNYAPLNDDWSGLYKFGEYSHYPLVIVLFLMECYGDEPNLTYDSDLDTTKRISPEIKASFCSRITFQWFTRFVWFGYKNNLRETDLWKTTKRDLTTLLAPRFIQAWFNAPVGDGIILRKTYQAADGKRYKHNHVFLILFRLGWARFFRAATLKLGYDLMLLTGPIILKYLIRYMSSDDPQWHGILIASLFLIVPTLQSFFIGNYFFHMQIIGMHIRSMIMGAVYRKSFLLSNDSREKSTSGEMVNLMAVDAQHFQDLLLYINLLWSAPLQIILAIVMLYRELGWSIFAGVSAMITMLPLIATIARYIKVSQIKLMKIKDERIKRINEILSGIRVIKLYAWENSFISNIMQFRTKELEFIKKIYNLDAIQAFMWNAAPLIVAVCAFGVYILSDSTNSLDAEKAFVSLSLFAILRFPLTMLPQLVNSLVLTLVSAKRIDRFLNSDELVRYVNRHSDSSEDSARPTTENLVISIEKGTLSWNAAEKDEPDSSGTDNGSGATLKDIDVSIKKGSFIAIVGQVGSGKSALISGLLGDMRYISGKFSIVDWAKIAYVPQEAWIQNMSLRNNILFGREFNEDQYNRVLEACSLVTDLDSLARRDESEIGEKGINISGGQKQRVSLARACYSNSDIYLMDDPLSALDAHVSKHVFNEVLSSKTGLLKNKTRVLATNNLFVLPYVDQILVLKQGKIVESGSYDELMKLDKGQLAEIMRQYQINQREETESSELASGKPNDSLDGDYARSPQSDASLNAEIGGKTIKSQVPPEQSTGKLTDSERMETGSVSLKIYYAYFKAISYKLLFLAVVLLISASAFNVGTSVWLSIWSEDTKDPVRSKDRDLRTTRISGYAILVGLNCLMTISAALTLARGVVRASRQMHDRLLEGVMHSPMLFFDTTPVGRITNRFAKDIHVIDSTIPGSLRSYIICSLQVISSILLVCIIYPKLLILLVPLAILYYAVQKIFIVTTRQLKRLESTTRSPIFNNFNETLSGMASIKAYDCVERFVLHSDKLVDLNNSCSLSNIIANRWLGLRLEFLGNIITTSVAMFSVFSKGTTVNAGLVGLVVSYSSNVTQYLSWLVRMTSDLETNIVGVERVLDYSGNKREDDWIKEKRPGLAWPDKAAIDVVDFSARYRQETALVLSKINVNIKAGEKIGVLGRTGSGKSSLSLSLFRILEAEEGKICIDGQDIAQFGLHDVRSNLTIIPQDPVLFSGNLRFNLDPLKLYRDFEIWQALELAHLRSHISTLDSGLDSKVAEFGDNFSLGQRQLICLARAILRRSKILVLDEATASVDIETDSLVQKTIRDVFKDCTIITIAHRIHTILDSDRILVMDQGTVKELGKPRELIKNRDSAFVSLLKDAGIDETKIFTQDDDGNK